MTRFKYVKPDMLSYSANSLAYRLQMVDSINSRAAIGYQDYAAIRVRILVQAQLACDLQGISLTLEKQVFINGLKCGDINVHVQE